MRTRGRLGWVKRDAGLIVCALLCAGVGVARGGSAPSAILRSFDFPLSSASGVAGDLVIPAGTMSKLTFEAGKVAVGDMPGPLPERAGPRRRGRAGQRFVAPTSGGPHARLLLSGVADGDGNLVTNSSNQLVIDCVVSPSTAAPLGQPFTFPFDLNNGFAFLDIALPLEAQPDGPVRLQIIGITVLDPEGQPFATLGFQLPAPRATPVPSLTPPAIPTAMPEGWCFRGMSCAGAAVPSSQEDCCRANLGPGHNASVTTSWCAADQFDAATGQCATRGCQFCAPPATPTPGPCANLASCNGSCTLACADGTAVAGQCAPDANGACQCSAVCAAPTPCGAGECFDTLTGSCTGQSCGPGLHCPLPDEICDVGGQRCPCQPPPPLPHGHICCLCKDHGPACLDFSYVEVQPICPPGCDTFLGRECDAAGATCVALAPCATDHDCDDGNDCTVDRCTASGCTHDCVCVAPAACGPGPAGGTP